MSIFLSSLCLCCNNLHYDIGMLEREIHNMGKKNEKTNIIEKKSLERLQNNLQAIRKVAGLTTEELGDMIGVTKQTISNIENHKTEITKTQYLALVMAINVHIEATDNINLKRVVEVLLAPDADEEEEMERIIECVEKKRMKARQVAKDSGALHKVGGIAAGTGAVVAAGTILGGALGPIATLAAVNVINSMIFRKEQ